MGKLSSGYSDAAAVDSTYEEDLVNALLQFFSDYEDDDTNAEQDREGSEHEEHC